jgi:hypothetical protein
MSMNVMVEIELAVKPKKKHWKVMQQAAEALTDDKSSIRVSESQDVENTLVVEFTMERARQIDVVDHIGDEFSEYMDDYEDSSISFPRTMKKRE